MLEIVTEIRRRKKLVRRKRRLGKSRRGMGGGDRNIQNIGQHFFSTLGSVAYRPFLQKTKPPTCPCTKRLTGCSGLHKNDGTWREKNEVGEDLAEGLEKKKKYLSVLRLQVQTEIMSWLLPTFDGQQDVVLAARGKV